MRLGIASTLAILFAFSGTTSATGYGGGGYTPPPPPPAPGGGGSDVCASVDSLLKVASPLLPSKPVTFGNINACICISGVPSFILTNPVTLAAIAIGGKQAVINAVTALINSAASRQTCSYPSHCSPQCQSGYPCGFTCKDGFTPSPAYRPTSCVCQPPYTVCNGKCGNYKACPSSYVKRDMYGKHNCPAGLTTCGVYGKGAGAWECVDTKSDLESCGGCTVPLLSSTPADGVDCTAIPGVADVSCAHGQCVVHRCMPGYERSPRGDECIYSEDLDPALLAAQFGLDQTLITN